MLTRIASFLLAIVSWVGGGVAQNAVEVSPTPPLEKEIETTNGVFEYDYFEVEGGADLDLVYNYEGRSDSMTIITANQCRAAVSGGFYDKNFRPLGLVIDESRLMSKNRPNQLFNGYVYVRPSGTAGIAASPVYANVRDAVQTGPILVSNGEAVVIPETSEMARRMAAVSLTDGGVMFMTIFSPQSKLDGPTLSSLGEAILAAVKREGKLAESAINLDGGAASVFYKTNLYLKEWQPVGSVWCLK